MSNWVVFWLCLHIIAAVVAFGPTFTFPFLGAMAKKEPMHIGFALRFNDRISSVLVEPFAVSMLVSGVGLLIAANIDLLKTTYLVIAVILYLIALGIGLGILTPTGKKLVKMVESMPAPGPGAAPGGPPPEFMSLIQRAQMFGTIEHVLFLAIISLMIIKPGGIVSGPIFG